MKQPRRGPDSEIPTLDKGSTGFDHGDFDPAASFGSTLLDAKASDSVVRAEPLHPPRGLLAGRLLPGVLLALAFAFSGVTRASTVSDLGSFDAESHAQDCKCGAKCRGASCCCGTKKKATPKAPMASSPRADLFENPCLNSAPCGDPILPASVPSGSPGKVAALDSFEPIPILVGQRLAPSGSTQFPPDRRASRLDRPPRALPFA